jgi:hypothetical protein
MLLDWLVIKVHRMQETRRGLRTRYRGTARLVIIIPSGVVLFPLTYSLHNSGKGIDRPFGIGSSIYRLQYAADNVEE